ncbi:MAG: putative quinol monooxygenase [Chloroflexota bacterium]|nr:MAG: antibiotic biosynthesis monooxygenase [Chloroflexota bacterium]
MHIVHVHIRVKPEYVDQFIEATLDNVRNSNQEPGNVRFDFFQEIEDPTKFVLTEIYRTPEDADRHKETAHYLRWRERVGEMMAEQRYGIKYRSLYPDEADWK